MLKAIFAPSKGTGKISRALLCKDSMEPGGSIVGDEGAFDFSGAGRGDSLSPLGEKDDGGGGRGVSGSLGTGGTDGGGGFADGLFPMSRGL